jgi:hypothetical protein
MLTYQHSGFSVDAGVCIKAHDRAALERLLRRWLHRRNRPPGKPAGARAYLGCCHNRPSPSRYHPNATIALPVGGADRPYLRGVAAAVPICGGQMRLIAFIPHCADIGQILDHIGVESEPPHITPARGPPLWEQCDAQMSVEMPGEPDWDMAAQSAPDYEVDQCVNW